jgi:insertion element IS1 protein InsB
MTVSESATPAVVICKVDEGELDEMWSFVGCKQQPRWLWGALDHQTGRIVAYVFGRREDQAMLARKAPLVPPGIRRFYTDGRGAYRRHLNPHQHVVGKRRTQQLERKHPTLSACSSTGSSSAWQSKIEGTNSIDTLPAVEWAGADWPRTVLLLLPSPAPSPSLPVRS